MAVVELVDLFEGRWRYSDGGDDWWAVEEVRCFLYTYVSTWVRLVNFTILTSVSTFVDKIFILG